MCKRESTLPAAVAFAFIAVAALALPAAADEPLLRIASCLVYDDCYCHTTDYYIDPSELVMLDVELQNHGTAPATGLKGRIDLVYGGAPLSGFGAFGPLSPLEPGESYYARLNFRVTGACQEMLDIDITALTHETGAFADLLAGCDREIGVGGDGCLPCCLPEDVDPIVPVFAVRAGVDRADVDFTWERDPLPPASHFNTYIVRGAANKPEILNARESTGWEKVLGCNLTKWTECRHYGAIAEAGLAYYQVRGACGPVEGIE